MKVIDLNDYINKTQSKSLTNFENAQKIRKKLKLDEVDKNDDQLTFTIPDNVRVLSFNFFKGLFERSVTILGKDKFLEKYHFESENDYILKNIEYSIDECIENINS